MAASLLSQSEMEYIKAGCLEDCRVDGRACAEFRPHAVLVPSPLEGHSPAPASLLVRSNGSARLLVDNHAQLLCSVKADVVRPHPSRPDRGLLELSVDYHPHHASSPTDEGVGGSGRRARGNDEEELQQLLEDLWLPHLVDLRGLCLLEGECAWRLSVDLLVLSTGGAGASSSAPASSAGCLLDASALVVRAALQSTWLPSVTVVPRHDGGGSGAFPGDAASRAAGAFELAVEGDMAKAKRVVLASDISDGGNNEERRLDAGLNLVTVTMLKCYPTGPSLDAPPAPRYVSVLDASGDEVGCSVCQVHVTVRTTAGAANASSSKSPPTTSQICALQMSAGSRSGSEGGAIPVSLLSEASRLAIRAVPDQRRCCRLTELSAPPASPLASPSPRQQDERRRLYLGREHETALLQEAYALQ